MSDNEFLMEVTKKEPEDSSALRISDVQSVKTEEGQMNFLKVRTPTSINNGSMATSSGKVLVKRLGSTTIRSVPTGNMHHAAKAQLIKMSNGNYQTHPTYSTSPRVPMLTQMHHQPSPPQAPQPKPVPTLYRSPPDPRDDIIRQLQEQNREMKKMLLECRRETSQIQTRMRRWTLAINEVLGKVQKLQAPGTLKAVPQKPTVIQHLPPPTPPPPAPVTPKGPTMKVTARKSTSLPPQPPAQPPENVSRTPAFPIKTFSILKTFENDLKNREFFDFVGQKLMLTISKLKVEKPGTLLAYVLQTLVNSSMLTNMVWDNTESPPDAPRRPALLHYRRLRELYSRLVNNMSKSLYGKNLDPAAVERFLRTKLYSEAKIRQQNVMIQQQQMAKQQMALEKQKAMLEAEQKAQPPHEDDDVEWIDDKVKENCELGNEILGDQNEQNSDLNESHSELMEHEERGKHPESTMEENDFHFMDC